MGCRVWLAFSCRTLDFQQQMMAVTWEIPVLQFPRLFCYEQLLGYSQMGPVATVKIPVCIPGDLCPLKYQLYGVVIVQSLTRSCWLALQGGCTCYRVPSPHG